LALTLAAVAAPLQIVAGDMHGLNTLEHQPAKIAAMEGVWKTEKGAALRLFRLARRGVAQQPARGHGCPGL
jgi:cytochrome d ubiquinol oxidase subunit I